MPWWACSSKAFGSTQSWSGITALQPEMLWLSFGHVWLRLAISTINRTRQEQVCHVSSTKPLTLSVVGGSNHSPTITQTPSSPTASTHRIHCLRKSPIPNVVAKRDIQKSFFLATGRWRFPKDFRQLRSPSRRFQLLWPQASPLN